MMENMQKDEHMLLVTARVRRANVVGNHVPDFFQAVLLVGEIGAERGGGHLRQMLMLGDGEHFLFGEPA
jgi:hypothetical protein